MWKNDLKLVELAFDYISAETELQAKQVYQQATTLATEETVFKVWVELVAHMEGWKNSDEHKAPMNRASALQFFRTRQAELNPAQIEDS